MNNSDNSLGNPIPDSLHAVSVSLPEWNDVIGYEEKEERVIKNLKLGYPRFVIHPLVQELFDLYSTKYTNAEESCFIFPSIKVAERVKNFIDSKSKNSKTRIFKIEETELYGVATTNSNKNLLKEYWQHSGEIISSRKAEYVLNNIQQQAPLKEEDRHKQNIKEEISNLTQQSINDIYLFPSGMAAIFFAHRLAQKIKPNLRTVQFGFPYTDTLKIQEKFGNSDAAKNVKLFPNGDSEDLKQLKVLLEKEKIAALFTEFPTNPLLRSVDLDELIKLSREHDFPIILDDTVVTFANANLIEKVDVVVTSLTKFFSGIGNSMAGSMIVSSKSPFYNSFKNIIKNEYENLLFEEDASTLFNNYKDFKKRMTTINKNTEALCDFLAQHKSIKKIYYPKFIDKNNYLKYTKPEAGFSGLFSIEFNNAEKNAPTFYNNLQISKGPSLGTSYTLACPYTLLAHYEELEFVEKCGIPRNLVRISVGTENIDDLIRIFAKALERIGQKIS